jgi:hypothetical protein
MIRFVLPTVALLVVCAPRIAAAQTPYIGASAFADVVLSSSPGQTRASGEALGGALRIGAPLGSQFGIELEVSRSGDIPVRSDVRILPAFMPNVAVSVPASVPADVAIFPPPLIDGEARRLALATLLSWRHEITERFGVVYLGGVTFMRTTTQHRIAFPVFFGERVDYDTGVTVGLDAGIEMTDHLRFVPGLRLISGESTWLIRPSAGLQWIF